ncbi:hypothetical protein GUITHDRAFT_162631 [Guillardia theta CCMP2712]|uniref:Uncharacterized protein n=1 Tax=Guillardia theta (strain CCMP2712) TaxID=905079 RepID=L1JHE4_GUITC|nr:hypothetical protein GUITHDRAFT_162631 [Guillardia theta CCMP2712]EKX47938.1 hypothetical protein GUITHDRAFT_162631 [Guillardia theta CCMP2712]|eukprot:XP_005834918.1 hypothetical protein GUITHDRAFT_162631 [Guillardia theta CCMP2712]
MDKDRRSPGTKEVDQPGAKNHLQAAEGIDRRNRRNVCDMEEGNFTLNEKLFVAERLFDRILQREILVQAVLQGQDKKTYRGILEAISQRDHLVRELLSKQRAMKAIEQEQEHLQAKLKQIQHENQKLNDARILLQSKQNQDVDEEVDKGRIMEKKKAIVLRNVIIALV